MMTQALLVLRLYAAQDRSLHCRSLESGSGDKHHQPQEDVARPFFFWCLGSKWEFGEVMNAGNGRVCGREDICGE